MNQKLHGSWQDTSTEHTFCKICKGKHYDANNSKRQAQVRTAMKEAKWPNSELPNDCAGTLGRVCLCQHAK